MELTGKNVLVTGGSRGIGRALVRAFAQEGSRVVINYLAHRERAIELRNEIKRLGVECFVRKADVSSEVQVQEMFSFVYRRMGKLDILVNNAGWTEYIEHRNLEYLTPEIFLKVFNINLLGAFLCSREAIKGMKEKDSESAIINIASTAALTGMGSNIAYCAAKAGVVNMTSSLARAFGPKIRINCIAPGLTYTDMTREKAPIRYRKGTVSKTPLGRIAKPDDVARVAVAVVKEMNFVNGQTIIVDGGRILNG